MRFFSKIFFLITIFSFFNLHLAFSQKKKSKKEKLDELVQSDTLIVQSNDEFKPTLELDPGAINVEKKKNKKKKRKKKVFYGVKTKVRFTKEITRNGNGIIYEKFYVLKVPEMPDQYVNTVYFFNEKERKIASTSPKKYKPEFGPLLHGSYQKTVLGEPLANGIFYKGTKHGRWERYGRDRLLLDKEYYYRGHPKESEVTFHDIDQKKLEEVIPIKYGKMDGVYLSYYKSGRIKEKGLYVDGIKVGKWYEYFDRDRASLKRETQYGNKNKPYEEFQSYIVQEWNEKGKKVIDNRKRRGR
ncbi:toxin-antitoxin system YwqK family antitoxin [Flexithrix dorotheae]|uniref:toxin-antitoxin system YwqK family antitoxin n=1 Tax=Flexithrix dorotheae TaxID=70993 RepID=UPI0003735A57|nr:hypothetical protein [Flexithrix dorotheae]